MTGQLFEIAFSGQIVEGADLETVKQHIAKIFKADDKRLEQLFSGQRVLIKRQVDEITAAKYRGAFQKAGAMCEVRALTDNPAESVKPPTAPPVQSAPVTPPKDDDYASKYAESERVPEALLTDPLGVNGEAIADLGADIAPVGSQIQHQIKEDETPNIDISGIDVAPVGSDLSTGPEDEPPPPPDTSGLTMAD